MHFSINYRYTAGVVGGLSAVAVCAPSDKFLNMGGPLAIGLGVVFASSIGKYYKCLFNCNRLLLIHFEAG